MRYKINNELLNVESMKKIIELVESGVLAEENAEPLESEYPPIHLAIAPVQANENIKRKRGIPRLSSKVFDWSKEEEDILREYRQKRKLSYSNIANVLNRDKKQVRDKIKSMVIKGLWKSDEKLHNKDLVKEYILKCKNQNVSYKNISERIKKRFGVNLSKSKIKKIYFKLKGGR